MIRINSTGTACSLVLAAVLVVSGCSLSEVTAGSEEESGAATSTLSEESRTHSGDASIPTAVGPSQGALELREEEKDFLAAIDAPAEVYQGAVLEAGYEACLRIEHTAEVDESALRSALAEGQIPDAEAAVRSLCPQFEEYLPDAGSGS